MELLTPAMIYCLTLFQGLNRPLFLTVTIGGEARKLNPAKQSLFQHAPSSLALPKKKKTCESSSPAFANLWLLLVYTI